MYKSCLCKCSFLFHNYLSVIYSHEVNRKSTFSPPQSYPLHHQEIPKKAHRICLFLCVQCSFWGHIQIFFLVGLGLCLWWRSVFWSGKSYFWLVVPKKETIDAITCIQKNLCMCPCQPSFLKRWLISKHSSFCCYMLHISLWVENRIK